MTVDTSQHGHPDDAVVLRAACARAGLDRRDARLIRVHANAIYHLPHADAVARIRDADAAESLRAAVRVTRWLSTAGFPAVQPLDADQPVVIGDRAVTFWRYLPRQDDCQPGSGDLARRLRQLHRMPPPPFPVPATRPLGSTRRQAAISPVLTSRQRAWLLRRCDELAAAYHEIDWILPRGIVHGDAHTGNLLPHPVHQWVLIDWDSVSPGPPEYDFMPVYNRLRRFGYPPGTWQEFTRAYGTGLTGWPGMDTLSEIREIRSLAAFIRNAPRHPAAHRELANRLDSLISGDRTRRWHAL